MGYPTYSTVLYCSVSTMYAAGRLSMIQLWWYWSLITCWKWVTSYKGGEERVKNRQG